MAVTGHHLTLTNLHRKLYDSFKADTAINTVLQALSSRNTLKKNINLLTLMRKAFPVCLRKTKAIT